jgi:hypothetical protein
MTKYTPFLDEGEQAKRNVERVIDFYNKSKYIRETRKCEFLKIINSNKE